MVRCGIADCEDGERGPKAKECAQPLGGRTGKKVDYPPEPCEHLDFSPVRQTLFKPVTSVTVRQCLCCFKPLIVW